MNRSTSLKLIGRPRSHFTRVALIFAHELNLAVKFETVSSLQSFDPETYGGNPCLKIPVLHFDGLIIIGTENICHKLIDIAGQTYSESFVMHTRAQGDFLQFGHEILIYAMGAQVQIILGVKYAKLPLDNSFFAKTLRGLQYSLDWLEQSLDSILDKLPRKRTLSLFEVMLFCLIEHLPYSAFAGVGDFPKLNAFAKEFAKRDSALCTAYPV